MFKLIFSTLLFVCFSPSIIAQIKFSEALSKTKSKDDLRFSSQKIFQIYVDYNTFSKVKQDSLLTQLDHWLTYNDIDTASLALLCLNHKLNTIQYDSVINPTVNYAFAKLYFKTGNSALAKEKMIESLAGWFLIKDSTRIQQCYLALAGICIRTEEFEEAKRYANRYQSFDSDYKNSSSFQIVQLALALIDHNYIEANTIQKSIEFNQLENPIEIGTYFLFSRILAIANNNYALDDKLNNQLMNFKGKGTLFIAKVKNTRINFLRRNNTRDMNHYIEVVTRMPDYGLLISRDAMNIGTAFYSASYSSIVLKERIERKWWLITFLLIAIFSLFFIIYRQTKQKSYQLNHDHQKESIELANMVTIHNQLVHDLDHEVQSLKMLHPSTTETKRIQAYIDSFKKKQNTFTEAVHLSALISPNLYRSMKGINPDINVNDVKLTSLIMVQLDNKEIAQHLNISIDAARKRKQRLKQKLGLSTDEELFEFLLIHSQA